MSTDLKLEKFSGPLELLLSLIEMQELDITEISLAQVVEQFFAYLDKLEENHPEQLADFLVVATRLVYLKSKTLLPYLMPEKEEDENLADQLKMYKRYVDAGVFIQDLWNKNQVAYGRVEPPVNMKEFIVPENALVHNLYSAFNNLLGHLKPSRVLPQAVIDRSISVKHQIQNLYDLLKKNKKVNFFQFINTAQNRTEIIVSFLAVLELTKQQKILFTQANSFDDFIMERI
jgi:segregation and condensation protein A